MKFEEKVIREKAVYFIKGRFQDITAQNLPNRFILGDQVYIMAFIPVSEEPLETYPIIGENEPDTY